MLINRTGRKLCLTVWSIKLGKLTPYSSAVVGIKNGTSRKSHTAQPSKVLHQTQKKLLVMSSRRIALENQHTRGIASSWATQIGLQYETFVWTIELFKSNCPSKEMDNSQNETRFDHFLNLTKYVLYQRDISSWWKHVILKNNWISCGKRVDITSNHYDSLYLSRLLNDLYRTRIDGDLTYYQFFVAAIIDAFKMQKCQQQHKSVWLSFLFTLNFVEVVLLR